MLDRTRGLVTCFCCALTALGCDGETSSATAPPQAADAGPDDGSVLDAGADAATDGAADAGSDAAADGGPAEVRAFPGAEGFGAYTGGGRGGQVIEVTTLADSGPGSLREALGATGPRIVVFRVGGTIVTQTDIRVREPYCTIAGQTAPGDGIVIRGAGLRVNTHDVIIRGLRVRVGDDPAGPNPENRDALGIESNDAPPNNVIVDHCSFSWAIDETLTSWYPSHDITVQWSIISEALHDSLHPEGGHSKGMLVGPGGHRISVHHNLFAHNDDRNPLMSSDTSSEIVNNVVYDWGRAATGLSNCFDTTPSYSNVIANFYKQGPSTTSQWCVRIGDCWLDGSVYVQGNVGPNRPTDSGDEWLLVDNAAGDQVRASSFAVDSRGLTTHDAVDAYDLVLDGAGARAPRRDAIDERVVQSVRDGTGQIIDSQDEVGGWLPFADGVAPTDTDHDGMPDDWESAHALDPNDPSDGSAVSPSGYTWVEDYVNSLL